MRCGKSVQLKTVLITLASLLSETRPSAADLPCKHDSGSKEHAGEIRNERHEKDKGPVANHGRPAGSASQCGEHACSGLMHITNRQSWSVTLLQTTASHMTEVCVCVCCVTEEENKHRGAVFPQTAPAAEGNELSALAAFFYVGLGRSAAPLVSSVLCSQMSCSPSMSSVRH